MIKLSRRRIVLGAICAGLALLPAAGGWTGSWSGAAPAPSAAGSPVGPVEPSWLPVPSSASGSASASAPGVPPALAPPSAAVPSVPALGEPVGWKLSDIPQFPPPPAPEPITLPAGDRAVYLSRIPVTQPVAFLTIDDGYLKPAEAEKLFAAAHVPVTLFLTTDAIRDDVPFFERLRAHGAVIEAHTISHPELSGRSYSFQKRQICGSADELGEWYGRRPVLFRPPFGDKDSTTLRVAHECGLKAGFMWKETVHKGKVRYQDGKKVQPGDIILMHFRPAFIQDFIAALQAIHRAGLTPALLADYIPA